VFDLSGQQDNHSVPSNVTFKIRMDVNMVDNTKNFKVTDRCADYSADII
jgi:hypothetical protein